MHEQRSAIRIDVHQRRQRSRCGVHHACRGRIRSCRANAARIAPVKSRSSSVRKKALFPTSECAPPAASSSPESKLGSESEAQRRAELSERLNAYSSSSSSSSALLWRLRRRGAMSSRSGYPRGRRTQRRELASEWTPERPTRHPRRRPHASLRFGSGCQVPHHDEAQQARSCTGGVSWRRRPTRSWTPCTRASPEVVRGVITTKHYQIHQPPPMHPS